MSLSRYTITNRITNPETRDHLLCRVLYSISLVELSHLANVREHPSSLVRVQIHIHTLIGGETLGVNDAGKKKEVQKIRRDLFWCRKMKQVRRYRQDLSRTRDEGRSRTLAR